MSAALPADRRALVAIDLGAESCRVSLLRREDETLTGKLVHRFANGPVNSADGLHWPLAQIESGVMAGLRQCAALAPEGIRSIAVDGWAVDYVRLADDGAPAAPPFCYRDERTLAAEQAVHARVPLATLRALSGIQIQRINTAYQLVADQQAGYAPARWLNLPEYLLYCLGGGPVAELTNASHTQLVTLGKAQWCDESFRIMGLDPQFAAELVPPGSGLGRMQGPLAQLAAYRDTELIAPACHDTASAIAGIPADDDEGDWAYISSGTWSLVGAVLDAPENRLQACLGNYTNLAAAGGRTLFHKGLNGMWLLRQCTAHWEAETGEVLDLAQLVEAAAVLPAPERLLDIDDPELLLHGDMPERLSRQIARRGGKPLAHTVDAAAQYASLIFHSLAARYTTVLAQIESMTGKHFRRIYVVGGGSRNWFLNQLVARSTGLEVLRGPAESSTLGNFAVQLALLEDGAARAKAVARWARTLAGSCGKDGL